MMLVFLLWNCIIQAVHSAITDYTLYLTASSPAALDSHVKFTATLLHQNGSPRIDAEGSPYIYTWRDDVELITNVTAGNDYSEIFKTYPSSTTPNNYTMLVSVMKADNNTDEQLASENITFELSDHINFKHVAEQVLLQYAREPVFSTKKDIYFTVNVTDNFTHPMFLYTWNIAGPSPKEIDRISNSTSDTIKERLNRVGDYSVQITSSVQYKINSTTQMRNGTSVYPFQVKDPVSVVMINSTRDTVTTEEPVLVTITCDGSPPFTITWNISKIDGNITDEGFVSDIGPNCEVDLNETIPDAGRYILSVVVRNDVGETSAQANLTITQPAPGPVPASPGVIVASVLIGLAALSILAMTYRRERYIRRQQETETADFSFHLRPHHPLSRDGTVRKMFAKMKIRLVAMFKRQDSSDIRLSDRRPVTYARRYGAFDDTSAVNL